MIELGHRDTSLKCHLRAAQQTLAAEKGCSRHNTRGVLGADLYMDLGMRIPTSERL